MRKLTTNRVALRASVHSILLHLQGLLLVTLGDVDDLQSCLRKR